MKSINFTKMVATGNDFVVIENRLPASSSSLQALAKKSCDRKYGIGADGLLVLEKSRRADIKMRIFNADGSEAEMCGNGARCVALYLTAKLPACRTGRKTPNSKLRIETKAGIIKSEVNGESVLINLTDPKGLKLEIPLKVNNRSIRVNFINTGVPHTVVFVEGLERIDVTNLGRQIRFHRHFAPAGTNVNFVEVLNNNSIRVRTYERGVEDETLACGTGSVASALIASYMLCSPGKKVVSVHTKSGEVLKVYLNENKNKFQDIWLEGRAHIAYKGVYYV
jgi:diaminopimelate epimerase